MVQLTYNGYMFFDICKGRIGFEVSSLVVCFNMSIISRVQCFITRKEVV